MPPPQGCSGKRGVPDKPPDARIDVGAACTPPGDAAAARNTAGYDPALQDGGRSLPCRAFTARQNRAGGVHAAPTVWRELAFTILLRNLRQAARRGQDPALRNGGRSLQCRAFAARQNRRGAVWQAPVHCRLSSIARKSASGISASPFSGPHTSAYRW